MRYNKATKIVAVLLLSLISFGLGCGVASLPEKEVAPVPEVPSLVGAFDSAAPGTEVTIEYKEGVHPESSTATGQSIEVENNKGFFDGLNLLGIRATEAGTKDQGLDIGYGGRTATAGVSKGFGVLERLWMWIKSVFWIMSFGGIVLVILLFIPATAPIAGAILRAIGAVIPIVGSVIEGTIGRIKFKTEHRVTRQVIDGGQQFKKSIKDNVTLDLSALQKEGIVAIFTSAQTGKQDEEVRSYVKSIK